MEADSHLLLLPRLSDKENTVTGNLMEYIQQTYMNTEKSQNELLIVGITNENDFKLFSDKNVLKNHVTMIVNHFPIKEKNTSEKILNINISCLSFLYGNYRHKSCR